MTLAEDREIALEQIRYWRARGWSSEMAWMALTNTSAERNNALWDDCLAFMVRWMVAEGDAATRLAA